MRLSELASLGIGEVIGSDCEFVSVSTDTRTLKKGDLFVALKGDSYDAHELIADAISKECCAAVVDRIQGGSLPLLKVKDTVKALGDIAALFRSRFSGRVVAVTGSSGKTSVKGMLKSILGSVSSCIATEGNFNNHIGVPLTLFRMQNEAEYAVVEAGTSNPGEIAYLTRIIQPDVAVVINVMPAHIENFGSIHAIAKEKSDIYSNGPVDSIAVVNIDDPSVATLLEKTKGKKVVGFTSKSTIKDERFSKIPVLSTKHHSVDALGKVSFSAQINESNEQFHLGVIGPHSLQNALAALACVWAFGISLSQARSGLERFSGAPGRMQLVFETQNLSLIDDTYNANPGSMRAAVNYLSVFPNSILVSGDMGELGQKSEALHRELGAYAKFKKIKKVLTVGNHSKYLSAAFGEGAKHFENKEDLEKEIDLIDKENVVLLVKGSRSARMETVVNTLSKRWGIM